MEEHEKALSLLVRGLEDHQMAQEYCERYSQKQGRVYRQNLYQTLLRVYLRPQAKSVRLDILVVVLEMLCSHVQMYCNSVQTYM